MATFRVTEQTFQILEAAYREQLETLGKQPDKRTSAIAHSVIVKGLLQAEVARKNNVSKQWVSQAVNRYYLIYLEAGASGEVEVEEQLWARRTLDIPGVLAAPLDRFLTLAKSCKDPTALRKALKALTRILEGQSDKLE